MLRDIVRFYIENKTAIITSAPGNGASSFSLYLANILLEKGSVLYYSPDSSIDREFIKDKYTNVYNNCIFISGNIDYYLEFLDYIDYKIKHIIIDPADPMMSRKNKLILLKTYLSTKKIGLTCTSQIRMDPSKGGKVYSTIENAMPFDYSIWIRNVSETTDLYARKYIDIFDKKRSGNNYIGRHVANFTKEGQVLDI